jgi:hypothetical protein
MIAASPEPLLAARAALASADNDAPAPPPIELSCHRHLPTIDFLAVFIAGQSTIVSGIVQCHPKIIQHAASF